MEKRKSKQDRRVIRDFVKISQQQHLATLEDYFNYRRKQMQAVSPKEKRVLMALLNRSSVIHLRGRRHEHAVHSEIEWRSVL